MIDDFKKFLMRGNVLDLAVAVIIGTAFKPIISTLVDNIIMPPIGLLLGGVNFTELAIVLKQATGEAPAVAIGYGMFLQSIVDFVIIAFCIFIIIKVYERLQKKQEAQEAVVQPSEEVLLLRDIRDAISVK